MNRLNVGIIGCGNISATYLQLAPLFRAIVVKAVADIDDSVARARAVEFGVRADSVDDLLAAEDIDVIVNLTIPSAHYPITKRTLEAGKHAYSEKPLVMTLVEGQELRDLAAARGLRIGSAPDTFLGGSHQLARARLDEGLIGAIVGGTCHVMSHGMEHWHPNPDFFFRAGAGPMLDLGPYYLTNLVQLLGPVRAVSAMAASGSATRTIKNGPRQGEVIAVETPTNIHALLEFDNGVIVTIGASWDVQAHRHGAIELYGAKGSLYIPDPNIFGGSVELASSEGEPTVLPALEHPFGIPNTENDQGVAEANYRCAGLADMADAIINGRPHRCSIDLAMHVMDVLISILTSADKRQWVEMSTSCHRPESLSPEQAQALLIATDSRNSSNVAP